MASMTLVELTASTMRMSAMKTTAMPTWTRRRSRSSPGRWQMSTQKLVVMAVSAESALLNDAATMPMVNSTTTAVPSSPVAANMGSSSSLLAGRSTPLACANSTSSTPSDMKSRLAGTKATL